MSPTHFEVTTRIAASARRVFELSLDVDVHTASMAGSGERAVGGVTTGRMALGDTVSWEARHFGLRWRMTSLISACEPDRYFVDEQVAGPFKRWRHAHHFDPDGHGGTVMRDVVDFAAPGGPLGILAERAVLGRYMAALIRARNEHLRTVAEEGSHAVIVVRGDQAPHLRQPVARRGTVRRVLDRDQ